MQVVSDAPQRFAPGAALRIDDAESTLTVESASPHTAQGRDRLIVRFRECGDRAGADALRGAALTIPIEEAAPTPEGAYYPHQLEGLAIVDESGTPLGTFARVEFGRANDVWVVDADGREVLIPAVDEFVVDVDLPNGRIVLRPIPGMFAE